MPNQSRCIQQCVKICPCGSPQPDGWKTLRCSGQEPEHPPSSLLALHRTQTNILLLSRSCSLGELSAGSMAGCAQLFCQISWDALQLHTPPSPSKAACEILLLFEQTLAPIALTSSNYCTDKIKVLSCFANIFEALIQQQK